MAKTWQNWVAVLCVGSLPCEAQVVANSDYQAPISVGRAAMEGVLSRTPGAAVAVGVEGEIVWSEGFGYADLEREIPVEPSTIFRIFSLSKALTGVTTMRLAQAGRVDLDQPIASLLSGLPPEVGAATPRQLSGHLGGIRHYSDGEAWNDRHCETPDDALAIFAHDASVHPPGSAFLYTSWGYALLSRVLEAAAGTPFRELVALEVLRPAGMTSTSLWTGADLVRTSKSYERRGFIRKRNHPAERVDISCKWGGGAFLSTASDMARLGMALLSGDLLTEEALRTYFSEMRTESGDGTGYAMGLGVAVDDLGNIYHSHGGSGVGGRSALLIYPSDELVVVALANNREEAIVDFSTRVTRAFLDAVRDSRHRRP